MKTNRRNSYEAVSFNTICEQFKKKYKGEDILTDLKLLLEVAATFFGNPVGSAVAALISALADKKVVFDAGKNILGKIKGIKTPNYIDKVEKMRIAYGMIFYTAFFDTLDNELPECIRQKLQLQPDERMEVSNSTVESGNALRQEDHNLVFPNLCFDINNVEEKLLEMYQSMASRFDSIVSGLAFVDEATEEEHALYRDFLDRLPKLAQTRFHDQFLTLCKEYNEFYIFVSIEQNKTIETKIDDLYSSLLSIATREQKLSEAGLADLKQAIHDLPHQYKEEKVKAIADSIKKNYQEIIDRPLFEAEEGEDDALSFPTIAEAFIPQAFKLKKYENNMSLGNPDEWDDVIEQQDMTAFWARYLTDPNSVGSLLLILGEPGGGKSLLTKIVSARMSAQEEIVVRIPLRDYDIRDGIDGIETIVCEQIGSDGDASSDIDRFKWFAEEFPEKAITLIFDGYDEIQQATGMVYRLFLDNLRRFQQDCYSNGRPVRVVVTSRETLIDRAKIPSATMVMKLLEFDNDRKEAFIKVWNECNRENMHRAGLKEFCLPQSTEICNLSSQPLLLTMLAIYDADFENKTNALYQDDETGNKIDRTNLYDRLLRRFIRRELRKGKRINEKAYEDNDSDEERNKMVDREMRRLGQAALGMFVREKMSIKIDELEADFGCMEIARDVSPSSDKVLFKDAEVFLGGFFFIYDPRSSKTKTGEEIPPENKNASFEFLHKTFYEFLVADYILDNLFDAIDNLDSVKNNVRRGAEQYARALSNPTELSNVFPALNGACLCSEPEIIKMAIEWADTKMERVFYGAGPSERTCIVSGILRDIFDTHLSFICECNINAMEEIAGRTLISGRTYPQSCAVYILNLLTIRTLLDSMCTIENEKWSYISQYIKLNLPVTKGNSQEPAHRNRFRFRMDPSEELLLSFMAQFQIEKEEDTVIISTRKQLLDFESKDLLEAKMEIFDFMQDGVSSKLYALHSRSLSEWQKQKIRHSLKNIGMNLKEEELFFDFKRYVEETILKSICFDGSEHHGAEVLVHIYEMANESKFRICFRSEQYYYAAMSLLCDATGALLKNSGAEDVTSGYYLLRGWASIVHAAPSFAFDVAIIKEKLLENSKKVIAFWCRVSLFTIKRPKRNDYHIAEILYEFAENDINASLDILNVVFDIGHPEVIKGLLNHKELHFLLHSIYQGNNTICPNSVQTALTAIKLVSYFGYENDPDMIEPVLNRIENQLATFIHRGIDKLPELLRMGIKIGNIGWTQHCLSILGDLSEELFNYIPRTMANELLDIAKVIIPNSLLVQRIEQSKLSYRSLIDSQRTHRDSAKFSIIYCANTLIQFFTTGYNSQKNQTELNRILYTTFDYFQYLIEESTKTAVELLIAYEAYLKTEGGQNILYNSDIHESSLTKHSNYVQIVFDYTLADQDRSISRSLIKLVDTLDMSHFPDLPTYFSQMMPFIRNYSGTLAIAIQNKLDWSSIQES